MSQDRKNLAVVVEKPILKTASFLNFKVKREDWNLYKIEDGTLLRAKLVLTGVVTDEKLEELVKRLEPGQKLKLGMWFRSRTIFSTEPLPKLRGQPDSKKYALAELKSSIVNEDLDFETIREAWNLYELENGITIKVRLSPVAVNRTNKFDDVGLPIYTIDSNADMKIELPEHIRKLIEEKKKAEKHD